MQHLSQLHYHATGEKAVISPLLSLAYPLWGGLAGAFARVNSNLPPMPKITQILRNPAPRMRSIRISAPLGRRSPSSSSTTIFFIGRVSVKSIHFEYLVYPRQPAARSAAIRRSSESLCADLSSSSTTIFCGPHTLVSNLFFRKYLGLFAPQSGAIWPG